jgi:TetR/AcrR family transcriptional repressor of nem operon
MIPPRRGAGRARILEAAVDLVRRRGFAATSVDDLCAAAGVTKGAFFHHFASKEALGVALLRHWAETTGARFAAHPFNTAPDPLERVFGYLALRRSLVGEDIAAFSCVAGTTVQEAFETSPALRAASGDVVRSGLAHVERHLAEALEAHPVAGVTAASLALMVQVAVQGGIVVAKALDDPGAARTALDHAEACLRLLFGRPALSPPAS